MTVSYPPRLAQQRGDRIKRGAERFSSLPTIGGYQVIDYDGRPVIECETPAESREVADTLNAAAFAGTGALIAELRRLR